MLPVIRPEWTVTRSALLAASVTRHGPTCTWQLAVNRALWPCRGARVVVRGGRLHSTAVGTVTRLAVHPHRAPGDVLHGPRLQLRAPAQQVSLGVGQLHRPEHDVRVSRATSAPRASMRLPSSTWRCGLRAAMGVPSLKVVARQGEAVIRLPRVGLCLVLSHVSWLRIEQTAVCYERAP